MSDLVVNLYDFDLVMISLDHDDDSIFIHVIDHILSLVLQFARADSKLITTEVVHANEHRL